jgi:serine/threonine-protein kinase HipA
MTAEIDALDLREVTAADVYLGDEVVARLERTTHNDDVSFAYAGLPTDAGASVRDRSVSWSLLVTGDYPVITGGGAVPPFFAGLLPEGIRLGVVTSSTKTSADDHLTLLLAIGADTVGNVRVIPAGSTPPEPPAMFRPERDTDFRAVFDRLIGSVQADPVALAGVQPKVSAAMWSTPTTTTSGPAILKLNPPTGFPRLVENEHFFMHMAASCGLRVPKTWLLYDADQRAALLVERFDRHDNICIAQEDACQVPGLYPASKYRIQTETAISALADACQRGGGSRAAAVLELLRTVVFSWLIGNGDLHGKNMSIYAPKGLWQPSPAYDLLTTQPYSGWRDPMALTLYGRANRLDRAHFLDAATRLGLRDRAAARMIGDVTEAAHGWIDRCAEIGFTPHQTELLTEMLKARITSLQRPAL